MSPPDAKTPEAGAASGVFARFASFGFETGIMKIIIKGMI